VCEQDPPDGRGPSLGNEPGGLGPAKVACGEDGVRLGHEAEDPLDGRLGGELQRGEGNVVVAATRGSWRSGQAMCSRIDCRHPNDTRAELE
jgi:hypothetical protein